MTMGTRMLNIARAESYPTVLRSGPGSLGGADRLARGLGWFSLALGVVEVVAARRVARALGVPGRAGLVRACGVREIGSGVLSLSVDRRTGLTSRLVGDAVDIAALMRADHRYNRKRDNVALAMAMVLGVTALDLVARFGLGVAHSRRRGVRRDYSDRSGFPQGVSQARGAARRQEHAAS